MSLSTRLILVVGRLGFVLLLWSCVGGDGTGLGEGEGVGVPNGFVIEPRVSVVGAEGGTPESEALRAAFDRVDRFRMVVKRASGEVVYDSTITVSPGASEYTLSADVTVLSAGEAFVVTLTALEGETELFVSPEISVQAVPVEGSGGTTGGATVDVGLTYSGPGVRATRVEVSESSVVVAPGGSALVEAVVFGEGNTVIGDVPVGYVPDRGGVVEVDRTGRVRSVGEGAVRVVVSTPTGLEAEFWAYVVDGVVAYVARGSVFERAAAGGVPAQRPDRA